jgi:ABC-type uncharacterized transport system fused permease/ATPase subunit
MSEKNSLNYLFLKRFIRLLHVFLPLSRLSLNIHHFNERIYSHPLILILLTLINEGGLQFVIYYVGLLPKQYYDQLGKSPDKRDFHAFRLLIVRSFGLIILNALLKSLSNLLSSILYVKWRTRLVLYLHSFYFTQKRYYHISNTTQQNSNKKDDDLTSVYENYTVRT